MRTSLACGFVLAIAAMTAGCASAPASGQPTSPPPSGISAKPSSSSSTASPSPSPSMPDVPVGLPVMPGADPAEPDPGVMAGWLVDAVGPDVYRFYLDALPAAGFAVTDRFPGGNVAVIRFTTPDGITLDLSLVGEGEGSLRTRIELRPPEGP
jgi:hypothetical protein